MIGSISKNKGWSNSLSRRFFYLSTAVAGTLLAGTIGFHFIEKFPLFDAFYMSLITITTVGYKEIYDLSLAGRIFNSALIVVGVSLIYLAIGTMTQAIIEMELSGALGKKGIQKMINQLSGHYIVCGYGRIGRSAAEELRKSGASFVILEKESSKVQQVLQDKLLALESDATQDRSLLSAGIQRAQGLIAALSTDADNLFVVLSAKGLNPKLRIASRVGDDEAKEKFKRAGADILDAPYSRAGQRMAQNMVRPNVTMFLEQFSQDLGMEVSLEEIKVSFKSRHVDRSLGDLHLRREMGVIVLAIRREDGTMSFNPAAEARLAGGDCLVAMGKVEDLHKLSSLLNQE